jgi:hypothetical protein
VPFNRHVGYITPTSTKILRSDDNF